MSKGTCSVEGCERLGATRGWCDKHYRRWLHYGDPTVVQRKGPAPVDPLSRFWPKVDKNGPVPAHRPELGPCWLWTGFEVSKGYGGFSVARSKHIGAHVFAYRALVGPVPDGFVIDHLCHNGSGCEGGSTCPHRRCVNPAHLEAVPMIVNAHRGNKTVNKRFLTVPSTQ